MSFTTMKHPCTLPPNRVKQQLTNVKVRALWLVTGTIYMTAEAEPLFNSAQAKSAILTRSESEV